MSISDKVINKSVYTVLKYFPSYMHDTLIYAYNKGDIIVDFVPTKTITHISDDVLGKASFWVYGLTTNFPDKIVILVSSTVYRKNKTDGLRVLAHELAHAWQYIVKPEWVASESKDINDYDLDPVEQEAIKVEKDFMNKYNNSKT